MKNTLNFRFLWVVVAFLAIFTSCESDLIAPITPGDTIIGSEISADLRSSVAPTLIDPFHPGDAAFECSQVPYAPGESTCGYAWKLDASAPNGTYATGVANTMITIMNSDGVTFDWTSNHQVCAVIVKGGGGQLAAVYKYPPGVCSDDQLIPPINPNTGHPYEISHVTFCFNDSPCDIPPEDCLEEETAWSSGPRYTRRGNWATYTPYDGGVKTVTIFAGKTMDAGTATISDNGDGSVTIGINLNQDFVFYYDLNDPYEDENIKIQDYLKAPKGNPAPGKFLYKASAIAGTRYYSINVPYNNFYGIHLDVAKVVPCY